MIGGSAGSGGWMAAAAAVHFFVFADILPISGKN